jgi:hypothetical protein
MTALAIVVVVRSRAGIMGLWVAVVIEREDLRAMFALVRMTRMSMAVMVRELRSRWPQQD